MKYSEAKQGRVFVIRLEHGEVIHEQIEQFALEQGIHAAALILVGGTDQGSTLIVGPEKGDQRPIVTQTRVFDEVHELAGVGTLFWDTEADRPVTHIHASCGRGDHPLTGCIRDGVIVWQLLEIVLWELVDTSAARVLDETLGFKVLQP